MNNDNSDEKKAAEFLVKQCQKTGVSTASVKDGNIFMFKRAYLQNLLNEHAGQETITIFVQQSSSLN